jgi:hypothetical protein
MAQLPARQFISLDTLVTRARGGAKLTPSPSAEFNSRPRPVPRTLADLERASSLANRFVRPPTPPSALVLWVTVATCDCGRVHRQAAPHVLLRYSENEHSFHLRRADTALDAAALALPREVREKSVSVPFCEECFK